MTPEEIKISDISDENKFIHKYGKSFINTEFISLLAKYIKLTSIEYRIERNKMQTHDNLSKKLIKAK